MLFLPLLYVLAQYTAVVIAINASSLSWYDPQLSALHATLKEEVFARRSYFYVGGKYINGTSGWVITDQMYVEKLEPQVVLHKYPLVFITGGFQIATNWLNTPDDRAGWASYFLSQGYVVYLADHVKRGRSPWAMASSALLNTTFTDLAFVQDYFIAGQRTKLWPQAVLHTQWPGTAEVGDPTFDQFYASQIQTPVDDGPYSQTIIDAYSALLDKIGASVLVSHSQGGPYGWGIGDSRPNLVKAIIALEPEGPPFENQVQKTGPARPYGITTAPITYSPAVNLTADPNAFTKVRVNSTDPDFANCLMQAEPAKQLPNLQKFPILMLTTEASYHAFYDHCTYSYLVQAGVNVEWLQLKDIGIHGNAHFVFMEKNNMEVVPLLDMWIRATVK
ncbi:putative secreted lipase [Lachnellula occidentalis]|uniref:Putative secreted lipase n=1 Tax=Lachnellula occidentalis TaxID=215460 RepID=A0A8H8RLY7_9HELO|nr:putative secreted lipase [Lachnellula occidentalis]